MLTGSNLCIWLFFGYRKLLDLNLISQIACVLPLSVQGILSSDKVLKWMLFTSFKKTNKKNLLTVFAGVFKT